MSLQTPSLKPDGPSASHRQGFEAGQADFRLLVETIPDYAIFMLDPEGHILNWNTAARRIFGYEPSEIIGRSAFAFYLNRSSEQPEDGAQRKLDLELYEALTIGHFEEEGWRFRKDGSRFWASAVITPLRDDTGVLRGFGKVTRDLSERRFAEERYRLLVDSVRDYGIFMLDADGIIQSWNSGAEIIKGYSAKEIIGKHFSVFYTESDVNRNHPAKELEVAGSVGRFEEEGWRVRKDGSEFWASVVITALKNYAGEVIGYAKVTRDLTDRMWAEKALRESEEKFRTMISGIKDYAILMLDPEGHVISWNEGAERIKGWTEKEIIGKSFKNFYGKDDLENKKPEMELEAAEREGAFEDFGWRIRKDGSRFWANVLITALKDEKGKLKGFSKVTRNITERKYAEEELKKAYEDLEAFSYSVSHDLRAPLRSMHGFADVVEELLDDKLDDVSRDYLWRIKQSSTQMSTLIDDLLNLSRLGRAELRCENVNLSEMARTLAKEAQNNDPSRVVEFKIQEGVNVEGDPNLLRVVMANLFSNALKYTSKKDKTIIEFDSHHNDWGDTSYSVRDNGAGFDMHYSDKLFGAFQRLHSVKEFPGNGIGLATIKRIIQKHGGSVSAVGTIGEGASFTFSLTSRKPAGIQ